MTYDHFHAILAVYSGNLAYKEVYIEGGLAKSIEAQEYQEMRNNMGDDAFESWMIDLVSGWLPEGMTPDDQFEIASFYLAG